jgi:glyoxylase I family protein
MPVQVTGLDHLYIAVADIWRSEAFYDSVMRLLGFRKGTKPINNERHLHYFNPVTQFTIRPAKSSGAKQRPRTCPA